MHTADRHVEKTVSHISVDNAKLVMVHIQVLHTFAHVDYDKK